MGWVAAFQFLGLASLGGIVLGFPRIRLWFRRQRYTRGRQLQTAPVREKKQPGGRVWGGHWISRKSCRQHLLATGESGSGKSLVLRRTLKEVLKSIEHGQDLRCFAYDAENDIVPYLIQIGVTCPVYSLNPIESRTTLPEARRWDIATDGRNPAKALNIAARFVPQGEATGNSRFFDDMARILVWSVMNSFNRHLPKKWTYSDVVYACSSHERLIQILGRDPLGQEDLAGVFRDAEKMNVTGDNIFSTLYSKMAFHRPVAALWQRCTESLSMHDFVRSDSIVLVGTDETMDEAFKMINGMIFTSFVEEMAVLSNSTSRESLLWLDELEFCEAILQSGKLKHFLSRMRKKGGVFVGGFQDIEGFRDACGSAQKANAMIGQCSHKALLRVCSPETAEWSSALLGKYETIEAFESYQGDLGRRSNSVSEQQRTKDAVLPSEFFNIEEPSPEYGVEGYFISPGRNPYRKVIDPREFDAVVVSDEMDGKHGIHRRCDMEQILIPWTAEQERAFGIERDREPEQPSLLDTSKKKATRDKGQGDGLLDIGYEGRKQAAEQFMQSLDVSFGV